MADVNSTPCTFKRASGSPCGRAARDQDGRCIFHTHGIDPKRYEGAFTGEMASQKTRTLDIEGFIFPYRPSVDEQELYGFTGINAKGARFSKGADFSHVPFTNVDFTNAYFGPETKFKSTVFEGKTNFEGAEFDGTVNFEGAEFKGVPYFGNATFRNQTSFKGTTLDKAYFDKTIFEDFVDFADVNLENVTFRTVKNPQWCLFSNSIGLEQCNFYHINWNPDSSAKRWKLGDESRLDDTRDRILSDKNILDKQDAWLDALRVIETAYRELKVNYERHKNFPDAGHFHIGEMEMRLLRKKPLVPAKFFGKEAPDYLKQKWVEWISIIKWYRIFSEYGESPRRAFSIYVSIVLVCALLLPFGSFKVDFRVQEFMPIEQYQLVIPATTRTISSVKISAPVTSQTTSTATPASVLIPTTETVTTSYRVRSVSVSHTPPTAKQRHEAQQSAWKQREVAYEGQESFSQTFLDSLGFSVRIAFLRIDALAQTSNLPNKVLIFFEAIFAPLMLGLFALAVRRKVRRN